MLDNLTEVEFLWAMLQGMRAHVYAQIATLESALFFEVESPRTLRYFYNSLSAPQLEQIHNYFAFRDRFEETQKAHWRS